MPSSAFASGTISIVPIDYDRDCHPPEIVPAFLLWRSLISHNAIRDRLPSIRSLYSKKEKTPLYQRFLFIISIICIYNFLDYQGLYPYLLIYGSTVSALPIKYSELPAVRTFLSSSAFSLICRQCHRISALRTFSAACRFKKSILPTSGTYLSRHVSFHLSIKTNLDTYIFHNRSI